ncbi:MAG: DUF3577 domain-containing protein [Candidatus Thiodiazotropha weberae]|nr:DUF3577 domain-containing protein [Candidatus Thiodiazotropha weberae]
MSTSNNLYFDLHTTGLGYLGRAREVKPKAGQRFTPFWAVSISAFHGPRDAISYVFFDVKATGAESEKVIQEFEDVINDKEHKVLVGFNIGDMYPDEPYEKDGKLRVTLKGRLLRIMWVKVDGKTVYSAPQPSDTEGAKDDDQTPAAVSAEQQEASSESDKVDKTHSETTSGPVNGNAYCHSPVTDGQGLLGSYSVNVQMPSES